MRPDKKKEETNPDYLRRRDGLESLLASRVPNLSFNGATGLQGDALRGKFYSNGRVLVLREFVLYVSAE